MFQQSLYEPQGQSFLEMSKEGCILIPDITGFTKFVSSTDVITGRNITYELLATIVEANNLELKISEVEGDAILFYKYGTPPSVRQDCYVCTGEGVFDKVLVHVHIVTKL